MNIIEAVQTRKSIRDFKPDPIPKSILEKILKLAIRAPSASNAQPWEFIVIGGEVLEKVRQANVEKLNSGTPPSPEYEAFAWPLASVYRQRQVEIAKQLFTLMDIPRKDSAKRAQWMERGFRYFNAPAVIIITMDRMLPEARPSLDIGAVMQTICLVALEFELGTCIENQGVLYPDVLRRFAGIPDSKRIITAIAIGYPDWDFPANRVESLRESIAHITTWCGFE
ncbi:MAG: nitroreductase [Proteobacteria bacterium]|nr:nitroreductase [Pseudomonadota bacterium]